MIRAAWMACSVIAAASGCRTRDAPVADRPDAVDAGGRGEARPPGRPAPPPVAVQGPWQSADLRTAGS